MKIVFTTDQVYLHGGIEKVLSQKANYLAENTGHEVSIITYKQLGKKACYPFHPKIKFIDLGVNYHEGVSYFSFKNFFKIFKHKSALKAVIKQIQPAVIISCSFGPDFYFLPKIETHIPKIKEFHASMYFSKKQQTFKTKILNKQRKKAEARYDSIVVLNADETKYYHNNNLQIIPNPTETSTQKAAPLQSKKVMAAGRISPVKNFKDLISIWATINKQFPDWELHFYGQDYLNTQQRLQNQINKLKLDKVIKFMGVTANIKSTMQDYSIYTMTSETECFPMVLLEALSVGLPIVTYNAPTGPKHIVTHNKDGYLIAHKNKAAFIEKLSLLMSNGDLRNTMGAAALNNAERFNIDQVMQQWEALFIKLTTNNTIKTPLNNG